MKIKRSYLFSLISVLIVSMFMTVSASADSHRLVSQEIDVFIKNDGNALIKEKRIANLIEGTENYIPIENLGKSEIINFKVREDGREYQLEDNWNVDDSRGDKVFKNGIIKKRKGYELVWGIGEYGRHEYVLEYEITNFIKDTKDSQMLFWRFVNDKTNTPPEDVKLTIQSEIPFNAENQKVWGFGFAGNAEFVDGKVVAKSSVPLNRSNHVTILLKLDQGTFPTNDSVNKTFEQVKDKAFKGSEYSKGPSKSKKSGPISKLIGIISTLVSTFIPVIFIGAFIAIAKGTSNSRPGTFKRRYKEEYYRDYPYDGEILDVYYILFKIGLSGFNNILSGFILKWINEDKIRTSSEEVGVIRKKENTNINIMSRELPTEPLERELYNMLVSAAGGRNLLEEKEFIKWVRKNHTSISSWEKKAKEESQRRLQSLGHLRVEEKKKFFITMKDYHLTDSGLKIEENIYKYINYLYDYSLLNEHEAINVKIWDRIMIWAGFLGISEIVSKQFEQIYPEYRNETIYRGNSIYLANALTRNVSSARTSAASSGSGGGTSIGGGGGSFGGGSGGGTR